MAAAIRLIRTLKKRNAKSLPEIMVIEKSRNIGNHVLSGLVLDDACLKDILTDDEIENLSSERNRNRAFATAVTAESFHVLLDEKRSLPVPWVPPMMQDKGYPVGSLGKLTQLLAEIAEKEGVKIFTGFAAVELIEDASGRVIGARIGEKGVNAAGERKSNYLPCEEIYAKAVVLGEGACGILTEKLIARKKMQGTRPQSYAVGIKEIIEVPENNERCGEIAHTFGYPADMSTYGGGFMYHTSPTQVLICYAYALDYAHPEVDPHHLFRLFKAHPTMAKYIKGGKTVAYGAKVIPEGGYYSVPKLCAPGVMIVGDGAGLVDTLRIKGAHLAVASGVCAADALADCWEKNDFSEDAFQRYETAFHSTSGWKQLKRVRNVRAAFSYNTLLGVMSAGCAWATFGLLPFWRVPMEPDAEATLPLRSRKLLQHKELATGALSADKLTDVFMSGAIHDEDQPCHLRIKDAARCTECEKRFASPCLRFCPAEVYRREEGVLQIDFSNCLHCKTCQIKCPMSNIEWTFPQGGDGPRYTRM